MRIAVGRESIEIPAGSAAAAAKQSGPQQSDEQRRRRCDTGILRKLGCLLCGLSMTAVLVILSYYPVLMHYHEARDEVCACGNGCCGDECCGDDVSFDSLQVGLGHTDWVPAWRQALPGHGRLADQLPSPFPAFGSSLAAKWHSAVLVFRGGSWDSVGGAEPPELELVVGRVPEAVAWGRLLDLVNTTGFARLEVGCRPRRGDAFITLQADPPTHIKHTTPTTQTHRHIHSHKHHTGTALKFKRVPSANSHHRWPQVESSPDFEPALQSFAAGALAIAELCWV